MPKIKLLYFWVILGNGICCNLVSAEITLKDPTRPSGFIQKKIQDPLVKTETPLLLSAILISNERKIAIINNKMVQEGDRIQGGVGTVERINRYGVIVKLKENSIEKIQELHLLNNVNIKEIQK